MPKKWLLTPVSPAEPDFLTGLFHAVRNGSSSAASAHENRALDSLKYYVDAATAPSMLSIYEIALPLVIPRPLHREARTRESRSPFESVAETSSNVTRNKDACSMPLILGSLQIGLNIGWLRERVVAQTLPFWWLGCRSCVAPGLLRPTVALVCVFS